MPPLSFIFLAAIATARLCASAAVNKTKAGYAPEYVTCPNDVQWIRPAEGLSAEEAAWVRGRKHVVLNNLEDYLGRLGMEGFDVNTYISRLRQTPAKVPTISFAISGGGWASALTGTGFMRAMDNRLEAANEQRTGGLLQCMTYMAALSGGSQAVTSFALNNFPTADDILAQWNPDIDVFAFPANATEYQPSPTSLFTDIGEKFAAGFPVSFTDYFGIAIGYEFIPGPNGGVNTTVCIDFSPITAIFPGTSASKSGAGLSTSPGLKHTPDDCLEIPPRNHQKDADSKNIKWSSVTKLTNFENYEMPFPILQAGSPDDTDPIYYGLRFPELNATFYEMTPFEAGSWRGKSPAFTPTQYLGTAFNNGLPINNTACVEGFDRASYFIGTASSAYSAWYIEDRSNNTQGQFYKRARSPTHPHAKPQVEKRAASAVPLSEIDDIEAGFQQLFGLNLSQTAYAQWPNPFRGLASSSLGVRESSVLSLLDSAEAGQAIPALSLAQPAREPDFMMAWDSNQDTLEGWNNGTNLYNSYTYAAANSIPFPLVPDARTFVARNYTLFPVLFGCNSTLTITKDASSPIIAYFGNAPYSAYTNYSYGQAAFVPEQINEIFVNSFNQLTQGNGTLDEEWPVCLGCAAVERSLSRVGMRTSAQCERCFEKYCWDGTLDEQPVGDLPAVDPSLILDPGEGFEVWNQTHPF